ncbi:Concanavalin A-like lectin/glucanase, subgroup [Cordyceps fumosorosea ARSEF 2679]|uniref:Alpha-L-arabinofuranosidase n=1 Tax=Cordyceps fumosorosea (strain ARSEF 2679) TaxID=1081104 RepID=A0A168BQD7_CORFA|nr:Concanavalin A-like lectin/glucanase, subgroup [Cordyceps fumosorosea ARSEF 2679]OAA70417.1 Concanavalin A-like lectin/glucanase, subgroup [Cordyceps fumosorosea ARSEF 2679]
MFSKSNLNYAGLLVAALVAAPSMVSAGPCDIYQSGGTPCVAAHSTTRALYSSFKGALYRVSRDSDNASTDIRPRSAGGVADAAAQDSFCAGTTCLITTIYDQSGKGNHLTQAPPGSAGAGPNKNGYDWLASATGAPVTLNGQEAYGVFVSVGTGYRKLVGQGTARGDEPEGMYAVFDGTHYNNDCCFDYGNAETNSKDTGDGHMEAVYWGGPKNSPWVLADLENGLFATDQRKQRIESNLTSRFVTAILKGEPRHWALRGGDANSPHLETLFDGDRPQGAYQKMSKEGSIILGIGGDNSNRAQGTFYEGVMTSGYPSDATENKVQADIASAGYAAAPLTSGPKLTVGSAVSLRATTACCTGSYVSHDGDGGVKIRGVSASSDEALKRQSTWVVRAGLGNSGCFSFEARDAPGSFVRHYNYALRVDRDDSGKLFAEDATFCPLAGLHGQGSSSIRSWSQPTRYWRHFNGKVYIASNGGPFEEDAEYLFNDDASFVIADGWA